MQQGWFVAINQIINNISVLAIFLTGAAVLREREHGNARASPGDAAAAVRAHVRQDLGERIGRRGGGNGSLFLVVKGAIRRAVAGSIPLFVLRAGVYLFSVTALGIMLATWSRSMPQFGLLAFPVFIVMSLLSGGQTPLREHADTAARNYAICARRRTSSASPKPCCSGTRAPSMVWPDLTKMFLIGSAYTVFTLSRFRKCSRQFNRGTVG